MIIRKDFEIHTFLERDHMGIVKKVILICVWGVFAAGWAMGQPVLPGTR